MPRHFGELLVRIPKVRPSWRSHDKQGEGDGDTDEEGAGDACLHGAAIKPPQRGHMGSRPGAGCTGRHRARLADHPQVFINTGIALATHRGLAMGAWARRSRVRIAVPGPGLLADKPPSDISHVRELALRLTLMLKSN